MAHGLRLYDTLSGTVRDFEPQSDEVKLYVCGVTPYDTAHLGHACTYIAFDVLIRYLRHQGYSVRYVQNITDVDDPLFEKARQLGVPYQELAERETQRYLHDMRALNVLPADIYPRASVEIPAMLSMARSLVANGHAYIVEGHVYYRIATDPEYGRLSKLSRAEMIEMARERGGDPDDSRKDDPLDFLLWRPSGRDEFQTESEWGRGLPGWHLECSAMSLKYLGVPIDVHGGGSDLIYPHHESEIAQSESSTKIHPFARFWMHTGMVYMDGQKMSKSLGNMVFARDLVARYGADAVRIYVSASHYRTELHWDPQDLHEAAADAASLRRALHIRSGDEAAPSPRAWEERFMACMNDDLNTPGALETLRQLAVEITAGANGDQDVRPAQRLLHDLGHLLGLAFDSGSKSDHVTV